MPLRLQCIPAAGRRNPLRATCVLAALMLASCGRDQPAAPGVHTVAGRVRLIGYLQNSSGHFTGTRVVDDASGVSVELAYGSRIVATTVTSGGIYRFTGLGPGAYVARTHPVPGIADTTEVLTLAGFDVTARDTLLLASKGDLSPVPNPFAGSITVYFAVPDTEWVEVDIANMFGDRIRTLLVDEIPFGLTGVVWDGRDEGGHAATDPIYWVTFESGSDRRAHLLFH